MCRRISRFSGMYHLQLLSIFQSQVLEIKCARPLFSKCTCTKRPNIFQSLEKKTLADIFSTEKDQPYKGGKQTPSRLLRERNNKSTFITGVKTAIVLNITHTTSGVST